MSDLHLGRRDDGSAYHLDGDSLRTHGLLVGATGSGKTGLALVMLEELVQAGVPILAIDPKGDLGNLGLLFPQLDAASFAPWADGGDPDALATRWREGLAGWDLGPDDVAALKARLDLRLFTPGSTAGRPVDILGAFRRPDDDLLGDEEARLALVSDTVGGLLGLVGAPADPRDPAHVVLSTILDRAWAEGQDPDLATLVTALVDPPFDKVGVFPVDRFFPPDDRMDLAMALNGVLASPSFATWTMGDPLDVDAWLTPGDRTPVNVVLLAHLGEAERQFFLTLLLGRLVAWTRRQPGTDRLRALLFVDEATGLLPPHPHEPPTKRPLMTLLKQARAMGVGVLLASQNPVDLDHKAWSNAGTWLVGRLRTPQDRARIASGLPVPGLDDTIAALPKRTFLIVDPKGRHAQVGSRHALCFLRGPLTRADLQRLTPDVAAPAAPEAPPPPPPRAAKPPVEGDEAFLDPRVVFSARLGDAFANHAEPAGGPMRWRPALFAQATLRFDEDRMGFVDERTLTRVWFPLDDRGDGPAVDLDLADDDLMAGAPEGGTFDPLPAGVDEASELKALGKRFVDDVYARETSGMAVHADLKVYARGDETPEAFRDRVLAAAQAWADDEIAEVHAKAKKEADRLDDRLAKAERRAAEQASKASSYQTEELVGAGELLLSFFGGRRRSLTSVASRRRRTSAAKDRAEAAEAEVEELREAAVDLTLEAEREADRLREQARDMVDGIEIREVRLEKSDIRLDRFGILWIPVTRRV